MSRQQCLPGCSGITLLRLLQERALSSSGEWRSQIQAVDRDVLHQLQHNIAGGFDQDRFGPCIGFGNLKRLPQAPASLRDNLALGLCLKPTALAREQDRQYTLTPLQQMAHLSYRQ